MKNFIIKNQYTIAFVLVILLDLIFEIQKQLDIPENLQFYIKVLGLFLTLLLNRVKALNEKEDQLIESRHRTISGLKIRWTVFKMLKDMVTKVFSNFRLHNLFFRNGPSHLLLGLGLLFFVCLLPLPALWSEKGIFVLAFMSISAIGLGIIIEMLQQKYFEAIRDDIDIYVTWYGYVMGLPVVIGFMSLVTSNPWILLLMGIACWVGAFKAHSDF